MSSQKTKKERKLAYNREYKEKNRERLNAYAREHAERVRELIKRYRIDCYQRKRQERINMTPLNAKHQITICLFCKSKYTYYRKYFENHPSPLKWKHIFCTNSCHREYFVIHRVIEKLLLEPYEIETELKRLDTLGTQYVFPSSFADYNHACSLPKTNEFWRFGKTR